MHETIKDAYNFLTFIEKAISVGVKEMVLVLPNTDVADVFMLEYGDDTIISYTLITKRRSIKDGYCSFTLRGTTVHYKQQK